MTFDCTSVCENAKLPFIWNIPSNTDEHIKIRNEKREQKIGEALESPQGKKNLSCPFVAVAILLSLLRGSFCFQPLLSVRYLYRD